MSSSGHDDGQLSATSRDPEGVQSRADLARELTALRSQSGLTLRALSTRLRAPLATLGDYFSGRHLPGPRQLELFRALLAECGVTDNSEVARWLGALARARHSSDGRSAPAESPYRGLEPYGEDDAALFFGREAVTTEILERLRLLLAASTSNSAALALVGASGSGKSSVLRAGVLAALRAERLGPSTLGWECVVVTPRSVPVHGLRDLVHAGSASQSCVVVDQLEEIFADDVGEGDRTAFLDELARLRSLPDCVVLMALRADFYAAASHQPVLLDVLRDAQVLLGPMTVEEVRSCVVEPARRVGIAIDDALVEVILQDLSPSSPSPYAYDTGALPLLSYALLATSRRATRRELTVADYLATGGLRAAVRQSSEEVFGGLDETEQELARQLFLRLVNVDEDTPLTRRRVRRSELRIGEDVDAALGDILRRFIDARLLTADADTIEVSHEALLTAWPRLSSWIASDREGLRLHRQLGDATNAWSAAGRDQSLLLRGGRLDAAAEWVTSPGRSTDLNVAEREFLDMSIARASAERRAARRRTRRMRELVVALAVVSLVASGLAGYALDARASANRARDRALSRQVATEAQQLEATDPALAMQLALAGYQISPTVQARSTLLDSTATEMPTRLLGPSGPTFVAISRHRGLLVVGHAEADSLELYSLVTGTPRRLASLQVGTPSNQLFAVGLSRDGRLLATAGTARTVTLWNVADPSRPTRLGILTGLSDTVYSVAFSPNGRELAASSANGVVEEWNVADPSRPRRLRFLRAPASASLQAVTFSPSGDELAAGGANGTLLLWSRTSETPTVVHGAGSSTLETVAFSPNGRLLAAGGVDDLIRVWKLTRASIPRLARAPLLAGSGAVNSLAFTPDGTTLASGAADGSLDLWSTRSWQQISSLTEPDVITSLVYTANGHALVAADAEGVTRLWSMPPPTTYTTPGRVFFLDFTRRSHLLAAVTSGGSGGVSFFDIANPERPRLVTNLQMPARFGPDQGAAALSSNARVLAVDNAKASVQLLDLSNLVHPKVLGRPLTGASPLIEQMSFSPNGKLLAAGDDSGVVHLWNVTDPAHGVALPSLVGPKSIVLGIAFSPNGKLLAAASADDHVWLWNIADPHHPQHLATLGGFASYAYSVAFTPNGQVLIAGSADETVRLWDVHDPAHPHLLGPPLTGPNSYVLQVTVSPHGRTLAASTADHEVWLWNIATPSHPYLVATLGAASGQVFAVGFSPNGHTLVGAGSERTLYFWTWPAAAAATRVCALAGTSITRTEWRQYVTDSPYRPPCG